MVRASAGFANFFEHTMRGVVHIEESPSLLLSFLALLPFLSLFTGGVVVGLIILHTTQTSHLSIHHAITYPKEHTRKLHQRRSMLLAAVNPGRL